MSRNSVCQHSLSGPFRTASGAFRLGTLFCAAAAMLLAQPTLRITSPSNGTVVTPGQSLKVTVEATPADAFKSMSIIATWQGAEGRVSPPWEFTIKVPETAGARKHALTAVGAVTPGQPIYSSAISLVLEPSDAPATLRVQPSVLSLTPGGTGHLLVFGDFAGGRQMVLTESTRLKFTMDNPGILTVGDQGIVTALAPGSTKLTIAYGQAKTEIPVTVLGPRPPVGKR